MLALSVNKVPWEAVLSSAVELSLVTMTAEVSSSSNNNNAGKEWTLSKTLLVGLVVCCVISAFVNLLHAHQTLPAHLQSSSTAIHEAMKNFRQSGRSTSKETITNTNTNTDSSTTTINSDPKTLPKIGGLNCEPFGGPDPQAAQEMVYWEDIPSDQSYISPFHAKKGTEKLYMTFEPDGGGWNNIRMAMESVLGLAIAMGRTLVLPPDQRMYLLAKGRGKQKTDFSFADFFPMHQMAQENKGLEIISMQQFLEEHAMQGKMRDKNTGQVTFPPDNRTDWNGEDVKLLKEWLRNATHTPLWSPGKCMAAFPASGDHKDVEALHEMQRQIHREGGGHYPKFLDDPPPVDAPPIERMRENLAGRTELCVYDEEMQNQPVVHFMCYHKLRVRMLVHFYAFLFFEDWREDLWTKRFMRDHVRYIDEVQCAAGRIVKAMRDYAKSQSNNTSGDFDTFHIRRGDFQFKRTRIEAQEIVDNVKDVIKPGSIVYIATDERDKSFFDPMRRHYDIKFMDDFKDLLENVNSN